MSSDLLLTFINFLALALQILIVIRVIMSWVRPEPGGALGRFLFDVTDPLLRPFQKILPPLAGLDFSPILALVVIQILQSLAQRYLG